MSGWDFTNFAKTAISTAQKRIDKVLDIREEEAEQKDPEFCEKTVLENQDAYSPSSKRVEDSSVKTTAKQLQGDFFTAFGLGTSGSGTKSENLDTGTQISDGDHSAASGPSITSAISAAGKLNLTSFFRTTADKSESEKRTKTYSGSWSSWLGGEQEVGHGVGEDNESSEKSEIENADTKFSSHLPESDALDDSASTKEVIHPSDSEDCYEEVDLLAAPNNDQERIIDVDTAQPVLSFVEQPAEEQNSEAHADAEVNGSDWIQDGWKVEDVLVGEKEGVSLSETDEPSVVDVTRSSSSQNASLTASSSATLGPVESSEGFNVDVEEDSSEQSQCTVVDEGEPSQRTDSGAEEFVMGKNRNISLADELAATDFHINDVSRSYQNLEIATCVESVINSVSENSCAKVRQEANSTFAGTDDEQNLNASQQPGTALLTGGNEETEHETVDEPVTPEVGSEGSAGSAVADRSIADSFVHLDASEGSPPLSTQKSETSSVVKGSGYTSPSDEIETAASSDIEVISTNNGDTWSERSSRSGIFVSLSHPWAASPGRMVNTRDAVEHKRVHRRSGSDHGVTEVPVQICSGYNQDKFQKLMQLTEALEAREKKVLELSRDTVQLSDENESLRRQLKQIQLEKIGTEKALSNLQEKFSVAGEERDNLRRKCEKLEREQQSSGIGIPQLQRLLHEKEEQIQELVKEGEKLSKHELKHTNIIKKLREKEKETEKLVESQKQKLNEMESLKQKLRDKETQEIKYDDAVHQMKSTIERQEKRIARLQQENEEASEKARSLKVTLDNCYKQISELTRQKVAKETEIHQLQSRAEASQEQHLQEKLESLEKDRSSERQDLMRQIEELQLNLVQSCEEGDRRESSLRWEITQLQRKLQEAEMRNHELSDGVTSADAEQKALMAVEKERMASGASLEARGQVGQMEAQMTALKRDKQKLEDQLTLSQKYHGKMEEMKKKYQSDLELERSIHKRTLEDVQKEKEMLSSQFQFEKNQAKKQLEDKVGELMKQLDEKDQVLAVLRSQLIEQQMSSQAGRNSPNFGKPLGIPMDGRSASPTSTITSYNLEESNGDDLWLMQGDLTGSGFSNLLEKIRAKLQQRDGELGVLRDEVKHLQLSRDRVADELVSVVNNQQLMEERVSQFDSLQEKYRELDQRYQALLQMYGEKVEENEELKLDLQDVKAMYKQQLTVSGSSSSSTSLNHQRSGSIMVSGGFVGVGGSTISSQPASITPQILLDSFVNFDVKYAGLIPEIQIYMDLTGRTDFLKILDQGKEILLSVPVHMLVSVGFVKEDGCYILGIKIGDVGGNESISDLAELAELICRILGQCFQLVYTQATMQYFEKKESEGAITSNIFGDTVAVSDSSVVQTGGTPEGPSFISGSRTELNLMQSSRPPRHSSTTQSESDKLSSQAAADLIQEYIQMLHALLSAEELKQFAVLLKRWRSDNTPFSEFIQKVLELYGSERKHLLARMRTFISDNDLQYFESFLEQSGISENAECSLPSYSPVGSEGAFSSRLAESSGDSSAWNSMRLHLTPPIPRSQPPHHPMIEEEDEYRTVRRPPRTERSGNLEGTDVQMNLLGNRVTRMEIGGDALPQTEERF